MQEKDFLQNCDETLENLSEALEARDKDLKLDVEYADGILTIVIEESKKTYIINRHQATQKIWYSSPFSGANYFSYDEKTAKWLDSKGLELAEKLFLELKL
jgi:iron donor protein CyaY